MSSKGAGGCSIESPGNLSVFVGGTGECPLLSSLNMALVNVFYNPLFYLVYLRGNQPLSSPCWPPVILYGLQCHSAWSSKNAFAVKKSTTWKVVETCLFGWSLFVLFLVNSYRMRYLPLSNLLTMLIKGNRFSTQITYASSKSIVLTGA